jgi:hypothetical protein
MPIFDVLKMSRSMMCAATRAMLGQRRKFRRHITAQVLVEQGKQALDQLRWQVVAHAFDDVQARARYRLRRVDAAGHRPIPATAMR